MMGAHRRGMAAGPAWEEALVPGAAAGAANFLRHGLGTGSAVVVEDLARRGRAAPSGLSRLSPPARTGARSRSPRDDRGGRVVARSTPGGVAGRATPASRSRASESATGRPAREECASLPSTCTSPRSARVEHARGGAAPAGTAGGRLDQGAPAHQRRETRRASSAEVALGVGDERAEARARPGARPRRSGVSPSGPGAGSSRIQRPPPPSDTRAQLLVVEAARPPSRRPRPLQRSAPRPLVAQLVVERRDPAGELRDPHVVVVADVRRRADHLDAVASRLRAPSPALSATSRAPSSTPGRMWQCRSIRPRTEAEAS